MKRLLILAIVMMFSVSAWSAPIAMQDNYPNRYVVVKGDTLWDIAGKFLKEPWQWPQIWNKNNQIKNPHLIYPGDVLTLSFVDGQPVISVNGVNGEGPQASFADSEIFSEITDVRNRLPGTSIPMVPLSAVKGFLNTNRIIGSGTRETSPYVLAVESKRLIAGKGDKIYARGTFSGNKAYSVYRPGKLLKDPQTGKAIGQEARHIANVNILAYNKDIAEMEVDSSSQEINKLDFLLPRRNPVNLEKYYPSIPDRPLKGQILAVKDDATRASRWGIVTINIGHEDGLRPGNVLAVYKKTNLVHDPVRNENVEITTQRTGEIVAFRIFNRISYAIVARVNDTITIDDYVVNP